MGDIFYIPCNFNKVKCLAEVSKIRDCLEDKNLRFPLRFYFNQELFESKIEILDSFQIHYQKNLQKENGEKITLKEYLYSSNTPLFDHLKYSQN